MYGQLMENLWRIKEQFLKDLRKINGQLVNDNVWTINGKFMDDLGKIYGGFRENFL